MKLRVDKCKAINTFARGTNELSGHSAAQRVSMAAKPEHGKSTGDLCCSAQIKEIKQPKQRDIEEKYYSKYFNAFY